MYFGLTCCKRGQNLRCTTRRARCYYSTPRVGSHEKVIIKVGTSGRIRLDIHQPPSPPPNNPRILIHLPTTPLQNTSPSAPDKSVTRNALDTASTANVFSKAANATVITHHYRLSPGHQFPTSTHDVAAAYDWMLSNLLPRPSSPQHAANIAVTGSLIGGSLALALGLTESHAYPSNPQKARITAVAAHAPITDWLFQADPSFNPSLSPDDPSTEARKREIDHIYALRAAAFPSHKPSRCFDPFASPVHFLRSPARSVPPSSAAPEVLGPMSAEEAEFEALTGLDVPPERRVVTPSQTDAESQELEREAEEIEARSSVDGRRFRRPLRWPPSGSGLVLPRTRLSVGGDSVLRGQTEEIQKLLARAWIREGGYGGVGVDEGVHLHVLDDAAHAGVLEAQGDNKEELASRGEWLGKILDR